MDHPVYPPPSAELSRIEFAEDYRHVYKGYGGYAADNEFFDSMADI